MKTEDVREVKLKHRIGVELEGITGVPLLRVRVSVVRIHYSACVIGQELCLGWRDGWERIDPKSPIGERNVCTRHLIVSTDTKHARKDSRVGLLNHEQWDVQEGLPIVEAVSSPHDVFAVAPKVPGKAHPCTEVVIVVMRQS